jgi:YmgG-like glycine-zipper protein
MHTSIKLASIAALAAFASAVVAQTPPPAKSLSASVGVMAFPAKGQDAQKQSQDEGECFTWSKSQTGFDPMNPAASAPPPPPAQAAAPPPSGQRVRGAARGAAAGAVIGEVADDDAGKGAAIGATVGAMKGGAEKRKAQAQAQQQAAAQQQQVTAQQQAAINEQAALFKKGFGACLESKGYTVK